ncbi:type VI secretion system Vgr family protein [Burkholderia sp. IMCC1007]|uniref:type VI secretion system Vgr family protein n=1 Tax=Burkholderia sp. IMCC1007 TaxID=3004104 RepID=UPI0022B38D5A|nr:type VI secretion system tip protein VgrG [Burkholderia sp. IMCC1007]
MSHQTHVRFTFGVIGGEEFDVVEFHLTEALSETFRLELELASRNPAVDFERVVDQPARFTLWHRERPMRYVTGRISSFFQGETGFRRTRYRAVVEPLLARLALCSDWRIFQQQSVPEILQTVLDTHGLRHYEQRLTEPHLSREYCVQAGESDLDFVLRLAAEEGIFHRFDHSAEGSTLIHGDRLYIHGEIDGGPVRYNPAPGGDQPEPCLRRFTYGEQVRTSRLTQRDYTFKHPRYQQEHLQTGDGMGQSPGYERYDYPGRYKEDAAGLPFTRDRLRGLRRDASMAVVEGDDPRLVPGVAFDLVDHPRENWNHGWRPIRIEHHGTQYTSQAEESATARQGTHYRYTAEIIPDHIEWRPEPRPRPVIPGPQEATVVGPENEEYHVDEHGRVRVRFAWIREGRNSAQDTCWIRPASSLAGTRWGHITLPRIGQEVIVDFVNGDPDQPFIASRMYRVTNPAPYELPKFQTLSTLKTKEHKGQRASELRLDDTTAEISAALMNDHGASHLHLGYLTHPRPDGGQPRGEGFELRTDLHGALRAAQGLLLSTDEQPQAQGGQLSRAALIQCLESALELARNLGRYAEQHQNLSHDAGPQTTLSEAVRDLGHGANDEPAGSGGQPLIAISSPAGIAAGTPRAITLAAGQHLDAVAEQNQHLTAGQAIVMNAGQGISQFAHGGDLRHIAHQGQVLVQAQHDTVRIQADKSVEVSASNEHVLVMADKHVTLLCQGAYIKLHDGKIEFGCPGDMTFNAGGYNWLGAASEAATLPQFDVGDTQRRFVLTLPDGERPAANHPYKITLSNGQQVAGVTDEQGATQMMQENGMHMASFELLPLVTKLAGAGAAAVAAGSSIGLARNLVLPPDPSAGRPLTDNEVELAKIIYADSIDYQKVRIREENFLPWQGDSYTITPNGHLYLGKQLRGIPDFATAADRNLQLHFIHEMMHVWQHQQGINVLARGAYTQVKEFTIGGQYNYQLQPGKVLGDYNLEQQADIAKDYFAAKQRADRSEIEKLKAVLGNFPVSY